MDIILCNIKATASILRFHKYVPDTAAIRKQRVVERCKKSKTDSYSIKSSDGLCVLAAFFWCKTSLQNH